MPDRRLALLILAAVCTLLAPRSSVVVAATWETNGAPLAATDSTQTGPVVVPDGAGGAYVAWQENRNGWGITMQRLLPNGDPAPGWPASGRVIGVGYKDPVIAVDGNRGAYVAGATGTSRGIALWYVTSGGAVGTLPIPSLYRLQPSGAPTDIEKTDPTGLPFLLSDGGAGAYLAWTQGGRLAYYVALTHLGPSGTVGGWPGTVLSSYGAAPVMCPDDSGGVLLCWGQGVVVGRMLPNGTFSPSWPPTAMVGQVGADGGALISDGAGGALVFWLDRRSGHAQVYAQHLTAQDSVAAGWPADGLRLSQAESEVGIFRFYSSYPIRYSSVASDGAGGGYVAWSEARGDTSDIYVQHVRPDGSLAPGWPADGLAVCAAPGTQWLPTLAADGAGGVLVSWQDHRSGTEWDVYAQRVSGAGAIAWPVDGLRVCGASGDQVAPRIAADGAGGGIVGWQDARCGTPQIFGSRVFSDGTLPIGPEIATVSVAAGTPQADSGSIRVSWTVNGALTAGLPKVYCRHVDGPWRRVGTAWPDPDGSLVYSDQGALEGCLYGYALGVVNCGLEQIMGEVWVSTPVGHGFTSLALTSETVWADSGRVSLRWDLAGGEAIPATVLRRDSCSDWVNVGTAVADDEGVIRFMDAGPLFADHRLTYRLVAHACGTDHDLGTLDAMPAGPGFTPTVVSFINAVLDTASAALAWEEKTGPAAVGSVYRRDSTEDWSWRGNVVPRLRLFQFKDRGLRPGHRYEYRIAIASCGVVTWSDPTALTTPVPGTPPLQVDAHPRLALRGAWPNPASDRLTVDLALENERAAMLELIDLGGRRVLARNLGGLGSGNHRFALDGVRGVRSGVYLLRLSQDGHASTRRVTIVH